MAEPFIIRDDRRYWGGGVGYQLTDDLSIRWDWNLREKDRRHVPGIGSIRTMEHTTVNRSRVRIYAPEAVNEAGHKVNSSSNHHTIKLLDLKKEMRRLRPDDAEAVGTIDANIAVLKEQIQALREERIELVKAAWRRAVPVQSVEIVDAADANVTPNKEAAPVGTASDH